MRTHVVSSLAFTSFLFACGGGGGGGGTPIEPPDPLAVLAGTWLGVEEDNFGDLYDIQVTVDDKGNLTAFVVDGQSQGTGTIKPLEPGIFAFTLSDGSSGGLYVAADITGKVTYAFFLSDDGTAGVMQKDATGLPEYFTGDIFASWSGRSISVDANWDLVGTVASSSNFSPDGTFSITENGEVFGTAPNGEVLLLDTIHGLYECFAENSAGVRVTRLLMSPDKRFVAGRFFPLDSAGRVFGYPHAGSFVAWTKVEP